MGLVYAADPPRGKRTAHLYDYANDNPGVSWIRQASFYDGFAPSTSSFTDLWDSRVCRCDRRVTA
jgi:hypothetical protein